MMVLAISQADYIYLLQHADGMGLNSVSYRLSILSGELHYQKNEQGGSIELTVPLKKSTNTNAHVDNE